MKLIYRILIRLSLALFIVLTLWGFLFYITIVDEINDEVDDSLEDYSETIITRALADQKLPLHSDGSNNTYFLTEVSEEYAESHDPICYSDEMVYREEKKETEPVRILKTIFKDHHHQYYELTVNTPTIEKEDLQEAILDWMLILYFALLALILLINIWVFYQSMRPLYTLLNWMDHYTIGKTATVPNLETDITEFKKLNEAASRIVERNQAIFEQQKQFIGNASHELQTPLAICQNRLEMLTEGENLTAEQFSEITKIQQTLSYIIRLNKSLLFLSKIDNGQFQDRKELCINDIIRNQLKDYREIYSHKHIKTEIEENASLTVNMNENLATALITNLLKNAYMHNITGGTIQIRIDSEKLIFSNTGITEKLDERQIFQRFYQGKHAGGGANGLGLSIAASICKLYHFSIRYFYQETHCFEILFSPGYSSAVKPETGMQK